MTPNHKYPLDYTFATRLLSFAKSVTANCMAGEEEREYFIREAERLRGDQKEMATEKWERTYLENTESKAQSKNQTQ
jgi:hypothetical protein